MSKSRYQEKRIQNRGVKSFADLAPPRYVSLLPDWPDMHQWVKDGEDHVCIERKARTELGRALCLDNGDYPFTSRYFGRFSSIEGFWLYVTCPNFNRREHLRTAYGLSLQGIRREALTTSTKVNNIRAIVMQAMYDRIVQNEKLRTLFIDNTLPFDMYHIDNETGRRMRAPHMTHMAYVCYHLLFQCLSEGGDVDSAIQHARNDKEGDMYANLLPAYQIEWLKNQERKRLEAEERKRLEALAEEEEEQRRKELAALDAAIEIQHPNGAGVAEPVDVNEPTAEETVVGDAETEIQPISVSVFDNSNIYKAPDADEIIEVKPSDLNEEQIGSVLLNHAQDVIETINDNK